MADAKLTALDALAAVAAGDVLYAVDDPGGTPASKKLDVDVLDTYLSATTKTLTNKTFDANGTGNSLSNVDIADLANGTDGELITWDAAGAPAAVATGTATHVLTSNGAGAAPTFQAAGGGGGVSWGDTISETGVVGTTGFTIEPQGAHGAQRGLKIDSDSTGTGAQIELAKTDNSNGVVAITLDNFKGSGYIMRINDSAGTSPNNPVSYFNFNLKNKKQSAMTGDGGKNLIKLARLIDTAVTLTDDYDNLTIHRTSQTNHASANYTTGGSLLKINHTVAATSGTLTDTTNLIEIAQDTDSTGAHILFNAQSNASVGDTDGQFWYNGTTLLFRKGGANYTVDMTAV